MKGKKFVRRVKLIGHPHFADWWYNSFPLGLAFDAMLYSDSHPGKENAYLAVTKYNDHILTKYGKSKNVIKNLKDDQRGTSYHGCFIGQTDWDYFEFETNEQAAVLLSEEEIE